MKTAIKILISGLSLLLLLSCTTGKPYEIKSPCVSSDAVDAYSINPCVRRPVNLTIDIT